MQWSLKEKKNQRQVTLTWEAYIKIAIAEKGLSRNKVGQLMAIEIETGKSYGVRSDEEG